MAWLPLKNSENRKSRYRLGNLITSIYKEETSEDIRICVKYVAVTVKTWKYARNCASLIMSNIEGDDFKCLQVSEVH